jgi:phosphoenolpyruvate synthase/pyruvate phosphate dikinase
VVTARSGGPAHAVVVAGQMCKVRLVGCGDLRIAFERRRIVLGGTEVGEGVIVTQDGHEGGVHAGARGRGGRLRVVWRPGPKAHSLLALAARPTP